MGFDGPVAVVRGPLISIFSRGEKRREAPCGRPRALRRAPSLSLPQRGRGRRGGRPQGAPLREGAVVVTGSLISIFSRGRRGKRRPAGARAPCGARPLSVSPRGGEAGGDGRVATRPYGRGRWASMAGGGRDGAPHLNLLPGGEEARGALRAPARLAARALSQSPPEGERFKVLPQRGRGRQGRASRDSPLREGSARPLPKPACV